MDKTIIGIYGRANEGKSETIKQVCRILLSKFPNAISSNKEIDYEEDILVAINLGNIKIGLESQGDPKSRIITENTLNKLADENIDPMLGNCDIIVCATRTIGETVGKVDQLAGLYGYNTLWLSSFWSPSLDSNVLNNLAAENIIGIIKSLAIGQLSEK